MKAIIGLGNPGNEYSFTRHNIGFEIIDYFADKNEITFKYKHKAYIGAYKYNKETVLFVKPQTYMNASGESIVEIVKYYDLQLEDIIVIYDDVDLEFARVRIRQHGSAGTHNGMRSVIYQLRSESIPRIRIGIGKPNGIPLSNYVLQKFSKDEMNRIREIIQKSGDIIQCFIDKGINMCMNKYNNYE